MGRRKEKADNLESALPRLGRKVEGPDCGSGGRIEREM